MSEMTSQVVKVAVRKALYVGFAEVRNGQITYRDGILADSVKEAIATRFGGELPEGFIVEKCIR